MLGRLGISLVVIGLALLGPECISTSSYESTISLESLCNNRTAALTRISEARYLIKEYQWLDSYEPCRDFEESLNQIDEILEIVQMGRICNLKLIDKIRKYHLKFIDNGRDSRTEQRQSGGIPEPLRNFFISLCLQISAECKMSLINNLEHDTKSLMTEADFDEIRLLEEYGATLLGEEDQISNYDDLLLLNILDKDKDHADDDDDDDAESKLVIKVKTTSMLHKLVDVCGRKFKPFYDRLIMPIVRLSKSGYNYQGELLERELEELKRSELVKRWYNIVQTCEAFKSIRIFEEDSEVKSDDSHGGQLQMITLIGKDEAALLEGRRLKSIEGNQYLDSLDNSFDSYWPPASQNSDKLWITNQEELVKLMALHKTSTHNANKIRSRLMKRVVEMLKRFLLSGKVKLLMSKLVGCDPLRGCQTSRTSVMEDMILMMDEAVALDQQERGLAIEPLDKAVSAAPVRSMVTRNGPASRSRASDIPPKINYFPRFRDGTKLSTKIRNFSLKIFPSRVNLFMWILAILGMLMMVMYLALHG